MNVSDGEKQNRERTNEWKPRGWWKYSVIYLHWQFFQKITRKICSAFASDLPTCNTSTCKGGRQAQKCCHRIDTRTLTDGKNAATGLTL